MVIVEDGVAPRQVPTAAQPRRQSRALLAYGSLALPLSLAEIPIILYLPAFYARELSLSAALVGAVFLVARLWDGLSDILVGWLSDRTRSRFGRRKPWVVVGAPFLMISTWFLCHPPQHVGFLYLAIWTTLFYTSFTAVKIPHLSWGTELATDYVERSRVTTYREAFTMLGNLIFVSLPLIFLGTNPPLGQVLLLIVLTVLCSAPVCALLSSVFVCDAPPAHPVKAKLVEDWTGLLRDRILVRFLVARLFWAVEEGVANSLLVFSFAVGLQLPSKLFIAVFVLYVATLCALPITLSLARRVEKHRLLALGVMIQALTYAAVVFIPSGHLAVVLLLWALLGLANTAMLSLPTSILADIIDSGELTAGERRSGTYVAADNLVFKIGMALGVGLSFELLSLAGFSPSATQYTAADSLHLRLLGFGLPSLLSIPPAILYAMHPITRGIQQKVRDRIDSGGRVDSSLGLGEGARI